MMTSNKAGAAPIYLMKAHVSLLADRAFLTTHNRLVTCNINDIEPHNTKMSICSTHLKTSLGLIDTTLILGNLSYCSFYSEKNCSIFSSSHFQSSWLSPGPPAQ